MARQKKIHIVRPSIVYREGVSEIDALILTYCGDTLNGHSEYAEVRNDILSDEVYLRTYRDGARPAREAVCARCWKRLDEDDPAGEVR